MKTFQEFISEAKSAFPLKPHPLSKMKDETEAGLPWEHREFKEYSPWPKAFRSLEHFKSEYAKAPVRHLTPDEHKKMSYSTHMDYVGGSLKDVENDIGDRRDVSKIADTLKKGKTAYPIAVIHDKGIRIIGGNTRNAVAAAHGLHLPHKVFDFRTKK